MLPSTTVGPRRSAKDMEMVRSARDGAAGNEIVVGADVSQEDQVQAMFKTTLEAFGSLDVLVNNAGIQKACPSHEMDAADFDRVWALIFGAFSLRARGAPALPKPGRRRSDS